jgi:hypothetical protein
MLKCSPSWDIVMGSSASLPSARHGVSGTGALAAVMWSKVAHRALLWAEPF